MITDLEPIELPVTFTAAVQKWRAAAVRAARSRIAFECAHAKALVDSKATNEAGRKADALSQTSELKLASELDEVEAKTLQHVVLYLRHADEAEEEKAA